MKIQAAWVVGAREWEVKLNLARCLFEDAEHVDWLRKRITELRGGKPEAEVDEGLELVMEEALHANGTLQFLSGVYHVIKQRLIEQYKHHLSTADPLLDAPTLRVLEFIVSEEERQINWFKNIQKEFDVSEEEANLNERWVRYLDDLITQGRGIGGDQGPGRPSSVPMRPTDHRFILPINGCREDRYRTCERRADPDFADDHSVLVWQFRHHRDEMQATEIFASILFEIEDVPWDFVHDVARHCWDESRHCRMGQQRLQEMGIDSTEFPVMVGNLKFQLRHLEPLQRYALTTLEHEKVEMPNKRIKYDRAIRLNDLTSATCTDYDWSDEINHVRMGKKWVERLLRRRRDMVSVDDYLYQAVSLSKKYFLILSAE